MFNAISVDIAENAPSEVRGSLANLLLLLSSPPLAYQKKQLGEPLLRRVSACPGESSAAGRKRPGLSFGKSDPLLSFCACFRRAKLCFQSERSFLSDDGLKSGLLTPLSHVESESVESIQPRPDVLKFAGRPPLEAERRGPSRGRGGPRPPRRPSAESARKSRGQRQPPPRSTAPRGRSASCRLRACSLIQKSINGTFSGRA